MQVLKFGGTSVGSVAGMQKVLDIITRDNQKKVVVLSAMSGTTDALELFNKYHSDGAIKALDEHLTNLKKRYEGVVHELFYDENILPFGMAIINDVFHRLKTLASISFNKHTSKEVVAQGELLSTQLFSLYCGEQGHQVTLLPALSFMIINELNEPDLAKTRDLIMPFFETVSASSIYITQGYICRNATGEIDNLQRGGSDYTATILGAVLHADEIQIWTDIDGVHNNDPRIVDHTTSIRSMSYREAAELAYFGAKILHPTCVLPAERLNVPLRLKYTMDPEAPGTLISSTTSQKPITAIAAKDGITAIKIYSHRMLMAYGFLRKVFQVFEDYETPVDMITTAEVAVSVTVDDTTYLQAITTNLSRYGEVEAESGFSIICIVGNELYTDGLHMQSIFSALKELPIRMISLGGSKYNISILLRTEYKKQALVSLNSIFLDQ